MRTIEELIEDIEEANVPENARRQALTTLMRDLSEEALRRNVKPDPDVLRAVANEHLNSNFRWLIELILADAEQEFVQEVLAEFNEQSEFDMASRIYLAVKLADDNSS